MEQINAQEQRLYRMNDSRSTTPESRRNRERIIAMATINARDNFNAGQYRPGGRIVVARRNRALRQASPTNVSQLQQTLAKATKVVLGGQMTSPVKGYAC